MDGWMDVVLRLGAATLISSVIGLNRDLHDKPAGVRTLGLVGLGSALVVVISQIWGAEMTAASRVIQGIVAGIGFLGMGLVMRAPASDKVQGLTTAAAIWLTACIGAACGLGAWKPVTVATVLVAVLLLAGGPIETWIHRMFDSDEPPASD